jgi:hypothetical protein
MEAGVFGRGSETYTSKKGDREKMLECYSKALEDYAKSMRK